MKKQSRYFLIGGNEPEDIVEEEKQNILFPKIDDSGIDRLYDYAKTFDPNTSSTFTGSKREFVYYIFITVRQFFGMVDSFGIPVFPKINQLSGGVKSEGTDESDYETDSDTYVSDYKIDIKDVDESDDDSDYEPTPSDGKAIVTGYKNKINQELLDEVNAIITDDPVYKDVVITQSLMNNYVKENEEFFNKTIKILDESKKEIEMTFDEFQELYDRNLKNIWLSNKKNNDSKEYSEDDIKAVLNTITRFTKEITKDTDIKPKMVDVLNITKKPLIFNFEYFNSISTLQQVEFIRHTFKSGVTGYDKTGEFIVYDDADMRNDIGLKDAPNSLGLIPLITQTQTLQDSDKVDIFYIKDNVLRVAEVKTFIVGDNNPLIKPGSALNGKILIAHALWTAHKNENKFNGVSPPDQFPLITNILNKDVVSTRSGLKSKDVIPISIVVDLYELFEKEIIMVDYNETKIVLGDKIEFKNTKGTISYGIPNISKTKKGIVSKTDDVLNKFSQIIDYVKVYTRSSTNQKIKNKTIKNIIRETEDVNKKLNKVLINHLENVYGEDVMENKKYEILPQLKTYLKSQVESKYELYKESTKLKTKTKPESKIKTETESEYLPLTIGKPWTYNYSNPLQVIENGKIIKEGSITKNNAGEAKEIFKKFFEDFDKATEEQKEELNIIWGKKLPSWMRAKGLGLYDKTRIDQGSTTKSINDFINENIRTQAKKKGLI
jgi:septum formation inhibitor MinC